MANTRMLYHTVEDGNGQPRVDYTIHFQLTPAAYKAHASLPESVVTVTTNSAGYFETPLETGVEYKVLMYDSFVQQGTTIKYGNRNILTIVVPHGTEPIDLPTVIALDTEPDPDPDLGDIAQNHIGRRDNPHEVTAAQVDAYTTAEADNLLGDKADAIDLTAHTSDTANPHGVTAAQAGTYTSTEIDNALALKLDASAVPTELTDLDTSVTGAELDALKQAADQHGDIVTHDADEFATAAQGGKADTAVQPADIADFETSMQLDNRDTANRSRANHTGTQAISTVSGLQDALDSKVPTTRTVNGHALSSNVTLDKGDVGLGNVDNTSDASKPVSTATQNALDAKADKTAVYTQAEVDQMIADVIADHTGFGL